MAYVAEFHPQAWVNDYAVEIDHDGPNEWDCTVAFEAFSENYRNSILLDLEDRDRALDADDQLKDDPAAPEWVREHQGPFDIYIRKEA